MSTILDYTNISLNRDRYDKMILARSDVQRRIAYFKENIGKVSNADDLVADGKLYNFVMEAFDLKSQTYAKALIRKVLDGGVSDANSIANKMNDSKFKDLATTLAFAEKGSDNVNDPAVVQSIIDRFTSVQLEEDNDEKNPAVRLALYFKRKASSISNWYQVIADNALREVVFTAFDFPDSMATMDVDKLNEKLKARFDIADFKDADKVETFLRHFSAMYDVKNGSSTNTSSSSVVSLMSTITRKSRASIISIDTSVLRTLLNLPKI